MKDRDRNEFRYGEFLWSCTLGMIFPVEYFAPDAKNMSEEEALSHLRSLPRLAGSGLGGWGFVSSHFPALVEDLLRSDRVEFEGVFRGSRGLRVHALVRTPKENLKDLVMRLGGIFDANGEGKGGFCYNPDLYEVFIGSRRKTSSLKVHHPALELSRRRGETIGLDAAWNVVLPPETVSVTERSICLTGQDWVGLVERRSYEEILRSKGREAEERSRNRISAAKGSLTIGSIQNAHLFEQVKDASPYSVIREGVAPFGILPHDASQTNFYELGMKLEGCLVGCRAEDIFREQERFSLVRGWMESSSSRLRFLSSSAGVDVVFAGKRIAHWTKETGRVVFAPGQDEVGGNSIQFMSQKIDREEVRTILGGMILDALSARGTIGPRTRLASWLGPLASSFADTYEQLRWRGLILGEELEE